MLSNAFYMVNFTLSSIVSIIGLIFCLLIIIIVSINRKLHTVTDLLICNTSLAIALYFISITVAVIFGIREDWSSNQPACVFRAYCIFLSCAALCYSCSIQAISRLVFTVFYQYRFLHTWRTHWILIILNWLLSFIVSIGPFFVDNGFALAPEMRICIVSPKIYRAAMYVIIIAYVVPLHIVVIAYGLILYNVRQSTRRVKAFVPAINTTNKTNKNNNHVPNTKRDLRLIRNVLIQTNILLFGGTPYLILTIWATVQQEQSPPEFLYLPVVNLITMFTGFLMFFLFYTNKNMKNTVREYLCRHRPLVIDGRITRRQQQMRQIVFQ